MTKNIVIKKKSIIRHPIIKKGKKSKIQKISTERYDINSKKKSRRKKRSKRRHFDRKQQQLYSTKKLSLKVKKSKKANNIYKGNKKSRHITQNNKLKKSRLRHLDLNKLLQGGNYNIKINKEKLPLGNFRYVYDDTDNKITYKPDFNKDLKNTVVQIISNNNEHVICLLEGGQLIKVPIERIYQNITPSARYAGVPKKKDFTSFSVINPLLSAPKPTEGNLTEEDKKGKAFDAFKLKLATIQAELVRNQKRVQINKTKDERELRKAMNAYFPTEKPNNKDDKNIIAFKSRNNVKTAIYGYRDGTELKLYSDPNKEQGNFNSNKIKFTKLYEGFKKSVFDISNPYPKFNSNNLAIENPAYKEKLPEKNEEDMYEDIENYEEPNFGENEKEVFEEANLGSVILEESATPKSNEYNKYNVTNLSYLETGDEPFKKTFEYPENIQEMINYTAIVTDFRGTTRGQSLTKRYTIESSGEIKSIQGINIPLPWGSIIHVLKNNQIEINKINNSDLVNNKTSFGNVLVIYENFIGKFSNHAQNDDKLVYKLPKITKLNGDYQNQTKQSLPNIVKVNNKINSNLDDKWKRKIIKLLPDGTDISVKDISDNMEWLFVEYKNPETKNAEEGGWVFKKYFDEKNTVNFDELVAQLTNYYKVVAPKSEKNTDENIHNFARKVTENKNPVAKRQKLFEALQKKYRRSPDEVSEKEVKKAIAAAAAAASITTPAATTTTTTASTPEIAYTPEIAPAALNETDQKLLQIYNTLENKPIDKYLSEDFKTQWYEIKNFSDFKKLAQNFELMGQYRRYIGTIKFQKQQELVIELENQKKNKKPSSKLNRKIDTLIENKTALHEIYHLLHDARDIYNTATTTAAAAKIETPSSMQKLEGNEPSHKYFEPQKEIKETKL
tara:strand:+ start:18 stop:2711 length:2694 start_codon:yes stop_codon:yes gene_type:complete